MFLGRSHTLPVCQTCGKKLKNPDSPAHLKSKFHQEKLKKIGEGAKSSKVVRRGQTGLIVEVNNLRNLFANLEKRILNIEKVLNLNKSVPKKIFSNESLDINLEQEIINLINLHSNIQQIKGNFPIKNIKDKILKNFNITQKDFEDIILRLYRKQLIDLQPGGDPKEYHLLSPTGKKFYYLITKT